LFGNLLGVAIDVETAADRIERRQRPLKTR